MKLGGVAGTETGGRKLEPHFEATSVSKRQPTLETLQSASA